MQVKRKKVEERKKEEERREREKRGREGFKKIKVRKLPNFSLFVLLFLLVLVGFYCYLVVALN